MRRRDNLAAAIHMVVEAIFWFHPLIWWLGARLMEERERACDEEVLRLGNPPRVYAESILKICEFSVGSPLACISGVTGADLQETDRRYHAKAGCAQAGPWQEALTHRRWSDGGCRARRIWLDTRTAKPGWVAGCQRPAAAKVPALEVASIKPEKSGTDMTMLRTTPVGFNASNISLKALIQQAYGVEDNQILGAPSWLGSARYDIEAKVSSSDTDALHDLSPDRRRLMLQPLLADRFQLKVHTEVRELPVLTLVVAKGGPKLHEAEPGDTYPNGLKDFNGKGGGPGMMLMRPGQLTGQGIPLSSLARLLTQQLGSTVQDKTGLTGKYDFTLQWTPDRNASPMPGAPEPGQQGPGAPASTDSSGPSILTAVQEQLRLKTGVTKGPREVPGA